MGQADLKLRIVILPQSLKGWDHSLEPPNLAIFILLGRASLKPVVES